MIQSNHSQYVANSGISLVSLKVACETSAKASGIPGSTVQFLNPNQKDDVRNLASLLANVFMEREPVIHALTPADEEQREKLRLACQKEFAMLASSGIAVIAKLADNTIVAGVIVAQWGKREGPYPAPVGLEPMYDLFDQLDAQFARHLANRADPERQTLELLFGGVRRDFESHGIVADLIWIALLYACHHGYEEVTTYLPEMWPCDSG